jgi:hypothetical protein
MRRAVRAAFAPWACRYTRIATLEESAVTLTACPGVLRHCTPCGCNNFNRRFIPPDAVHLIPATPCGLHYPPPPLPYFLLLYSLLLTCAKRLPRHFFAPRRCNLVVNRGRGARHEAPLPGQLRPHHRVPEVRFRDIHTTKKGTSSRSCLLLIFVL